MKALITGASTGLGRDMTRVLHKMGTELYLVARNTSLLEKLKSELDDSPVIISLDLSDEDNCKKLYDMLKDKDIDILINNAGFGAFGNFSDTSLEREMNMVDLNIKGLHVLTKLFLADFSEKNRGYILNVASAAAFLPGPLMATYYATKAYVLRLTLALHEELRRKKSSVYVGILCPGPVDTDFNKNAGVKFNLSALKSDFVAKYAIRKMLKRKLIIIPGLTIKLGIFFEKFLPQKLLLKISYKIQHQKEG